MLLRHNWAIVAAACTLAPGVSLAQSSQALEAEPVTGAIQGIVTCLDPQSQSTVLSDIPVKLSSDSQPAQPLTTLTDAEGRFRFAQLEAGSYLLEVNLQGFKSFAAKVAVKGSELRVEYVHLELTTVTASIDVAGQVATVAEHSGDANRTLTSREIPALPMPEQTAREALP